MYLCLIAAAFIVAMLFIAANPRLSKETNDFIGTLDATQKSVYDRVVIERKAIFRQATLAGVLAGFVALGLAKNLDSVGKGCLFLAVAFIVQYFWYILSSKKDWMVDQLYTRQQLSEWRNVYQEYQKSYHWGLFLGMIGFFLLGYLIGDIF